MELSGATLGHDPDLTATGTTVFSFVVCREHLDFLSRIHVTDTNDCAVRASAHGRRAINGDQCVLGTGAIDGERIPRRP